MAGNTPHGAHIDAGTKTESFLQQSPCFVPTGMGSHREPLGFNPSRQMEHGHTDMYVNPQASQQQRQFQQANTPFGQRPLHPSIPQTHPNHFSFTNPAMQQPPHPHYPRPFPLPSHPDNQRRFVPDEQWRSPGEFNADNQRGGWAGGRTPPPSGPPFFQEGWQFILC